jgi:hypothetical protein
MNILPKLNKKISNTLFASVVFVLIFCLNYPSFAHGPDGHGEVAFTALQAVKKGIELYDRLVAEGKLTESWETELVNIKVFARGTDNEKEIVVQFNRTTGEPRSVYIFFSEKGDYSGSNFTGE